MGRLDDQAVNEIGKKKKKSLVKSFLSNLSHLVQMCLHALIKCLIIKSQSFCPDSFYSTPWNEVGKGGICGKLGAAFT